MASSSNNLVFEDFFPSMVEKLGAEKFLEELCKGFEALMDPEKEAITLESLKRNSHLLGLESLGDDEMRCMVREGDTDGDGALNRTEFCVLMFRLSPGLMEASRNLVQEAILKGLSLT